MTRVPLDRQCWAQSVASHAAWRGPVFLMSVPSNMQKKLTHVNDAALEESSGKTHARHSRDLCDKQKSDGKFDVAEIACMKPFRYGPAG